MCTGRCIAGKSLNGGLESSWTGAGQQLRNQWSQPRGSIAEDFSLNSPRFIEGCVGSLEQRKTPFAGSLMF